MKKPAIWRTPGARLAIAISISILALWLAFRGVDLGNVWRELLQTNIALILLGTLLLFASHGVRAWRWTIIARPMKEGTSVVMAFKAIMGAYAMNNVI